MQQIAVSCFCKESTLILLAPPWPHKAKKMKVVSEDFAHVSRSVYCISNVLQAVHLKDASISRTRPSNRFDQLRKYTFFQIKS